MELQGLSDALRKLARALSALLALLALAVPGAARAASSASSSASAAASSSSDPAGTPVLVSSQARPPAGYRLTGRTVERIAARDQRIRVELHRHPRAIPYEYTKGGGVWQVSWFSRTRPQRELAQVYVDDATGHVTQAWTGFQVAWAMARGYPGAFGNHVNALYIWLPLCALFFAPFVPWRWFARRRRGAGSLADGAGWSLLHLDLLMLLGFSVSLAFFNHGRIGISVPLVYPFLLYLLGRMLLLASGRGRARRPLRVTVPNAWLLIAVIFLVGFRVGLNVTDSNVIDVGYAGVIGADKVLHGAPLYGGWPKSNAAGDTYGPVDYYAYVPFTALFGWSGHWDDLPAAHAAAIAFDLLTLFGLYWLGRRVRGPSLGTLLAYAWASFPFTLFVLSSNSNDALVSLLVVLALLVVTSAPARGIAGALAALTKFAPLALAPLLARGIGDSWPRKRALVAYVAAYVSTALALMVPVLLDHNLQRFWHDTIVYQATRGAPFSIWGLWGGLGIEQHLAQGAAAALALAAAFLPRRRGVVEVAALGAAILIALQLTVTYWFYLYIVWFFPLVIVALFADQALAAPAAVSGIAAPAATALEQSPAAVAVAVS